MSWCLEVVIHLPRCRISIKFFFLEGERLSELKRSKAVVGVGVQVGVRVRVGVGVGLHGLRAEEPALAKSAHLEHASFLSALNVPGIQANQQGSEQLGRSSQ